MRELLPAEEIKRKWIISIIEKNYRKYGFDPVSHPAIEKLSVLEAKSGEGIKTEIFRFDDGELGLRFDLTVPLARMYAEHQELPLPFKRYAIDKVWRREEPQHGRYREFMQSDADILGSKTMLAEAELIACAVDILEELGLGDYEIRINNRKVSRGILLNMNIPEDKHGEVLRVIDKLDKKSEDEVKKELDSLGYNGEELLEAFKGDLDKYEQIEECKEGVQELRELFNYLEYYGVSNVVYDPQIARGLGYYTGTVYEFKSKDKSLGTIVAGGRYDNLIGAYGHNTVPAVGISFGVDRIMNLIEGYERKTYTDIVLVNIKGELIKKSIEYAKILRRQGLNVQIDIMNRNFRKQLEFASRLGVNYVGIIGPKEAENNEITLKNMKTGEQEKVKIEEVQNKINH